MDPRYYYTYRDLVNQGVHPEWALAATGNFGWETGDFKYPRSRVPGENSAGYPHFNGDRLTRFNEYRSKHGNSDIFDHNSNIGFIVEELQTKFPGLWSKMRQAPQKGVNPVEAFMSEYERPGIPALEGRMGRTSALRNALGSNQFADVPAGPVNEYQPKTPGMEVGVVPFNPSVQAPSQTYKVEEDPMTKDYPNIWKAIMEKAQAQNSPKAAMMGGMPQPFAGGNYGAQGGPNIWDMSMARAGMAGMENPAYEDYDINKRYGKPNDKFAELLGLVSALRNFNV